MKPRDFICKFSLKFFFLNFYRFHLFYTKPFLISFLLSCPILIISCSKEKRTNAFPFNSIKLVIQSDQRSTKLCVLPIEYSNTGRFCKLLPEKNPIQCSLISSESSLFSLPPRDAADILIKGLTEVQLKNPGYGKKIDSMIVLQLETEPSRVSNKERGTKELESILTGNKIKSKIQSMDRETMNGIIHEMMSAYNPTISENILFVYAGESILHATQTNSIETKDVLREDLGTLHLFEMGENHRKTFFACRQGISKELMNTNSGWENFETCREYIKNRFEESTTLKKNFPLQGQKKEFIYLMGNIWDELAEYLKKNRITQNDLKLNVRNTCKISTLELIKKNHSRNLSTKLCYHISYLDHLLEIFNAGEVRILPNKQLLAIAGIHPPLSPECGEKIVPKKK